MNYGNFGGGGGLSSYFPGQQQYGGGYGMRQPQQPSYGQQGGYGNQGGYGQQQGYGHQPQPTKNTFHYKYEPRQTVETQKQNYYHYIDNKHHIQVDRDYHVNNNYSQTVGYSPINYSFSKSYNGPQQQVGFLPGFHMVGGYGGQSYGGQYSQNMMYS